MLDILNEDGSFSGETASKKEAHEKGLWHRAAHVWFINSFDEILLQKRSAAKDSYPGLYDVSAAGHLSAGDTSLAGAQREIEEELGIKVNTKELIKIGEVKQQAVLNNGVYINNEWNDVYVVRKNIPVEDFVLQEAEVDHVTYISLKDFKDWVISSKENLLMRPEEFVILFKYLNQIKKNISYEKK